MNHCCGWIRCLPLLFVFSFLILFAGCSDDSTNNSSQQDAVDSADSLGISDSLQTPSDTALVDASGNEDTSTEDSLDPPDVESPVDTDNIEDSDSPEIDTVEPPPDIEERNPDLVSPPEDTQNTEQTIAELCFASAVSEDEPGPEYDSFEPTIGSHCLGTNHQDIQGVEKVVFLGDSVTVGSPNLEHLLPTDNNHFFRNQLATFLADHFDLDTGDFITFGIWKTWDALNQTGGVMESGDFKNCAYWGARTDDFLEGKNEIEQCFPNGGSDKRTLIVFTMGGNDIAKITEVGAEASEEEVAAGYPEAIALGKSTTDYLRAAVEWLKDPVHFPNGSYVLFANPYEFTDGTGLVTKCPTAGLIGFTEWAQPEVQRDIVIELLQEYMKIAVETQSDMIWLLEHFCGHGYVAAGDEPDISNQCYLGPDAELYFDETCIHPNGAGHTAIYEMFKAVVLE